MKDKSIAFTRLNKLFDLLVSVFGTSTIAIYFCLLSTKVLIFIIIPIIATVLVFAIFFILSIESNKSILYALHPKNYNSNFIKGLIWFWVVFIFFSITKINQNSLLCAKYLLVSLALVILSFIIDFIFYSKAEII